MKFNHDNFLELYQQTFAPLDDSARNGLDALLGFIEADEHITDLRWAAYMLATTKHECGSEWQPIKEYDRGKGRKYGEPAANGKVFFGRGFVQLTWAGNYKAMSEYCGCDLYANPDAALDPDIAYKIMSQGMRSGSFTGASLKRFFNDDDCQWVEARRIINGTDCAEKIAGYAIKIYDILKETKEVEA